MTINIGNSAHAETFFFAAIGFAQVDGDIKLGVTFRYITHTLCSYYNPHAIKITVCTLLLCPYVPYSVHCIDWT
jgi:hypothetical protein